MTDLLIRPITIWQICGQIVDASFAIKGPPRRLMVGTVSRLITMKVICGKSIATDPLATDMMSMTDGHWPSRHKDSKIHNLPQCQPATGSMNIPNIRFILNMWYHMCKGRKTGTFKKGWGDKRLRKTKPAQSRPGHSQVSSNSEPSHFLNLPWLQSRKP